MSALQEALARFSAHDQDVIRSVLARWQLSGTVGRVVVRNMDSEHFLQADHVEPLLESLLMSASLSIDALQQCYKKECHNHVLQGGVATPNPTPVLLGRAVERDDFIGWLFDRQVPRVFFDVSQVEMFVDKLVRGEAPDSTEQQLLLSTFASWVTWHLSNPTGDPFYFRKTNFGDEVRANIGLVPKLRSASGRLLLFVYDGTGLDIVRPTIADAGLYPYFAPPTGTDSYGLTLPWLHEAGCGPMLSTFDVAPRPEALHVPAKCDRLRSVRELY
jgi:hypothetical protein